MIWQRLWPRSLFWRLAWLLLATALVSHVLALTLAFRVLSPPPPPPPPSLSTGDTPHAMDPQDTHHALLHPDEDPAELMRLHAPAAGPHEHDLPWRMLADISVRLAAVALAAWVAARWLSAPIRRLAQAAQALGHDIDRPPMAEEGPLEYQEVTRTFNQMQSRIRAQLQDRDRFVAAVSHDLRAPLTRLRLRAESLSCPAQRQKFQRDVQDMERMITATLSHLCGAAAEEPWVQLDMHALAHTVSDDLRVQGHDVPVAGQAHPLRAQPTALRRCLDNLVENAIRYGHHARIELHDGPDALHIHVHDQGPGLPANELQRVTQPFYQAEATRHQARGGVGLGLSIASDIARRHGGELLLRNGAPAGLIATIRLPRHTHTAG